MSRSPGSRLAAYLYLRISKEQFSGLKLRQNWQNAWGGYMEGRRATGIHVRVGLFTWLFAGQSCGI
jgi:hypothetical protein